MKGDFAVDKWEYLFGKIGYTMKAEVTIDKLSNIKLPKRSLVVDVVPLLGEDGWEVVQVDISAAMYDVGLVCKRQWQGGNYDVQAFISKLETIQQLKQAQREAQQS